MGPGGDRAAEAGIGASIIFIALILTSSTAGSLLLSNTNASGEQARAAFDDALDKTANHLEVRSATGTCDVARGELISIELLVTLGAGSDDLDISSMIIELTYMDTHELLSLGAGFDAEEVLDSGHGNGSVVARGDMWLISFSLPKGAFGNERVRVALVPADGFSTTSSFYVPDAVTATYISLR